MASVQRIRAVLGLTKKNAPLVLARAKTIYNAMSASPQTFPAPYVPLAVLLGLIEDLDAAQQRVTTGTRGTASARDAKRDAVVTCLEIERGYVQGLADANYENSAAIIEAAGMRVGGSPAHGKPMLGAKRGAEPNSVALRANARLLTGGNRSKKTFFNWQYSPDGGTTWFDAPSTAAAKTLIANLTRLTTYSFRVSCTQTAGQGEWSQVVSFLVV